MATLRTSGSTGAAQSDPAVLSRIASFHEQMRDFLRTQESVMIEALSEPPAAWVPQTPRGADPGPATAKPQAAVVRPLAGPDLDPDPALLPRFVPVPHAEPMDHVAGDLPLGLRVLVSQTHSGFHRAVVAALAEAGAVPILLRHDLIDAAGIGRLRDWIAALDRDQVPQALVWLDAVDTGPPDSGAPPPGGPAGRLAEVLEALAPQPWAGGRIVAATATGGLFGRTTAASPSTPAWSAATIGALMTSLAQDWPGCVAKAVDLDPGEAEAARARHLIRELSVPQGRHEVGYPGGVRTILRFEPASLAPPRTPALPGRDWVVLATGAMFGITADCLRALAPFGPTLVLAPRDPAQDVERALGQLAAELRALGARVDLPATDGAAADRLIRAVRHRHGRIDLVLLDPGRDDGPPDQAADPGTEAFLRLAHAPASEGLTGFCLLSSAPARPRLPRARGRKAALTGHAWDLARAWGPRVRVRSITFAEDPSEAAARGAHFLKDLFWAPAGEVESLAGFADPAAGVRPGPDLPHPQGAEPLGAPMILLRQAWRAGPDRLRWRFDLATAPYVDHHRFDGVGVMPIAAMMQMLAELPRAFGDSRRVVGLRNVQMFRGVTLGHGPLELTFALGPEQPGNLRRASVHGSDGDMRPHYRADLVLGEALPRAPHAPPQLPANPERAPDIAMVYRRWLSHGPRFQTLNRLLHLTDTLVLAEATGTRPADFVPVEPEIDWDIDPALADGLLQAMWTWTRVKQGASALPVGVDRVERYDGDTRMGPLTAECRVLSAVKEDRCVADLLVYDAAGRLCFLVGSFIGQSTPRLNRLGGGWQGGERDPGA